MDEEREAVTKAALAETSRNQTAKKAAQILLRSNSGFIVPTAKQKRLLLVEYAKRNFVIYGKAFDIVKLVGMVNPAVEFFEKYKGVSRQLAPGFEVCSEPGAEFPQRNHRSSR